MHKCKTLIIIAIFVMVMNLIIPVYADDEIEQEEITKEEINEILETTADVADEPIINSRYAVIYDRTSRNYFIWKKRI